MPVASVVFITSTNLVTNPRCVKEIKLALDMGFTVKVLACKIGGWSIYHEEMLRVQFSQAEIVYCDVTRNEKVNWLWSTFIEKASGFLNERFSIGSKSILSFAENKRSYLLLNKLKSLRWKADLVVAHNPSAFFPAYNFAKKTKAAFAVDVEDYHPGENLPPRKQELLRLLMAKVLPEAAYISFASPLIKLQVQNDLGNKLSSIPMEVINNSFSENDFQVPYILGNNEPLRLIWFSQNVDYKRGLEKVLSAFDSLEFNFSLTLVGNLRSEFYQREMAGRDYVIHKEPVPQAELHKFLVGFDIGLAVEDKEADRNRDLCLTNKIWAYFQAGLFIFATDTSAQREFLKQFPDHGKLIGDDPMQILATLTHIQDSLCVIREQRRSRWLAAKALCWENEAQNLRRLWTAA